MKKNKAGIFDGPRIRLLINGENSIKHMTIVETADWTGFVGVVRGFSSGSKNENCKELVDNMLTSFHSLGARMSVKVHFLFSHSENFPETSVNVSEEQISSGYQGHEGTISRASGCAYDADYCWILMRETREIYERKPRKAYIFGN